MSDMYMSDTEIATGYRTAKNKAKQVEVLAELNDVPRRVMEDKLVELGLLVETYSPQRISANYHKQRAPGKPERTPPPQEPAGDALTVRRLAEIFGHMAEWHPDAVVSVPAGTLSHVRLVSEYGQAGEPLLRVEMT